MRATASTNQANKFAATRVQSLRRQASVGAGRLCVLVTANSSAGGLDAIALGGVLPGNDYSDVTLCALGMRWARRGLPSANNCSAIFSQSPAN